MILFQPQLLGKGQRREALKAAEDGVSWAEQSPKSSEFTLFRVHQQDPLGLEHSRQSQGDCSEDKFMIIQLGWFVLLPDVFLNWSPLFMCCSQKKTVSGIDITLTTMLKPPRSFTHLFIFLGGHSCSFLYISVHGEREF